MLLTWYGVLYVATYYTNNAVKILSKDGFRRFLSKLSALDMVLDDIPRYVDWLFAALMSGKEVVPWLLE